MTFATHICYEHCEMSQQGGEPKIRMSELTRDEDGVPMKFAKVRGSKLHVVTACRPIRVPVEPPFPLSRAEPWRAAHDLIAKGTPQLPWGIHMGKGRRAHPSLSPHSPVIHSEQNPIAVLLHAITISPPTTSSPGK